MCCNKNFNGKYLAKIGPKLSEPTGDPDKWDHCAAHFESPIETELEERKKQKTKKKLCFNLDHSRHFKLRSMQIDKILRK
jgi:hypothetical protein